MSDAAARDEIIYNDDNHPSHHPHEPSEDDAYDLWAQEKLDNKHAKKQKN